MWPMGWPRAGTYLQGGKRRQTREPRARPQVAKPIPGPAKTELARAARRVLHQLGQWPLGYLTQRAVRSEGPVLAVAACGHVLIPGRIVPSKARRCRLARRGCTRPKLGPNRGNEGARTPPGAAVGTRNCGTRGSRSEASHLAVVGDWTSGGAQEPAPCRRSRASLQPRQGPREQAPVLTTVASHAGEARVALAESRGAIADARSGALLDVAMGGQRRALGDPGRAGVTLSCGGHDNSNGQRGQWLAAKQCQSPLGAAWRLSPSTLEKHTRWMSGPHLMRTTARTSHRSTSRRGRRRGRRSCRGHCKSLGSQRERRWQTQ